MPELPEVETIRRQLAPLVEGRTLERVEILDWRWCRPLAPAEMEDALTGRVVEAWGGAGSTSVWSLSEEVYLAQHLRMTRTVLRDPSPEQTHVRVRIDLGSSQLAIVDPRRFGTGELLLGEEQLETRSGASGLGAVGRRLHGRASAQAGTGPKTPVKAFLLDQRRMAGVGNIYADEALHRAHIHSAALRRTIDGRAVCAPAGRIGVGATSRHRSARSDDRRLPSRGWGLGARFRTAFRFTVVRASRARLAGGRS